MNISYNWLQSYFKDKLPKPEVLAEIINSHVFEIESVQEIQGGTDTVFDIKVMPDRAHHALSHSGIADEISAITGLQKKIPQKIRPIFSFEIKPKVKIEIPKLCKRYLALYIKGIKTIESNKDISQKLISIGSRTINSIVDLTNFVMFDIGQPMHAFDADKIKGGIQVRLAKEGENIELLPERVLIDGKPIERERIIELKESDIVIADDNGPIALAGIKGGRRAEIDSNTTNIIIESANFNPVYIRRTSTRLNLRNDASKRFENEIIPELGEEAIYSFINLLYPDKKDLDNVSLTDVFNLKTEVSKIEINKKYIEDKLGIVLKENELSNLLSRAGFVIEGSGDNNIVIPPINRLDIKIKEDIVDEIARIKGYDVVPAILPQNIDNNIPLSKSFFLAEKAKDILLEQGFSETKLYSLTNKGFFEIEYPLSKDKSALRESILPKIKESLLLNSNNADLIGLDIVKIFEIGKVFNKEDKEKTVLSIGVNIVKKKKGIDATKIIEDALSKIEDVFGISIDKKIETGSFGAVIEINFDNLSRRNEDKITLKEINISPIGRDKRYRPFSIYPFIVRDIALFVQDGIESETVWKIIKDAIENKDAWSIVKRASLFDVFSKKDESGLSKTSYAFRLVFESDTKTLEDTEINNITEAIYSALKDKGWQIR